MKASHSVNDYINADGKLTLFPAKRSRKLECLEWLAGKFEPGRSYSEAEVNAVLLDACTFEDPETLRRELCGNNFMSRKRNGTDYRLLMK